MICPKCQKENLAGSVGCAFCGNSLETNNSQPNAQSDVQPSAQSPTPTPSSLGASVSLGSNLNAIAIVASIVGGLVVLVGLGIGGYFLFAKEDIVTCTENIDCASESCSIDGLCKTCEDVGKKTCKIKGGDNICIEKDECCDPDEIYKDGACKKNGWTGGEREDEEDETEKYKTRDGSMKFISITNFVKKEKGWTRKVCELHRNLEANAYGGYWYKHQNGFEESFNIKIPKKSTFEFTIDRSETEIKYLLEMSIEEDTEDRCVVLYTIHRTDTRGSYVVTYLDEDYLEYYNSSDGKSYCEKFSTFHDKNPLNGNAPHYVPTCRYFSDDEHVEDL